MDRPLHLLFALWCVASVGAYKFFQTSIPNGDRVPHPCKPNYLWSGVGHRNVDGGGNRNPFGEDFDANGKVWNRCICERDSDGDGKTNGEELGDPECVWKKGDKPQQTSGISHPGVCEPVDDPKCLSNNDWSFCDYEEFDCPAANDPDVIEVVVRFTETAVPPQETSYFCMTFDLELPEDREYHMIASKPLITNANVMHHIIVAGCDNANPNDDSWKTLSPTACGMGNANCQARMGTWTLGSSGQCLPPEFGFPLGKNGYTTLSMQVHWNNPEERADYVDSSGLILYLTPNLRPNPGAILTVGLAHLEIPPQQELVSNAGYCPDRCTKHLPQPVYLSEITFHMHYLGRSAVIEHIRDGEILQLIEEESFSYDSPKRKRFDNPIEFQPGDEFKLTCNFKTISRSTTTYFGDATSDEMCLAFFTYYPARIDFQNCVQYKSLDICSKSVGEAFSFDDLPGACNSTAFLIGIGPIVQRLNSGCVGAEKCPTGCEQVVENIRTDFPCLQGDVGHYIENNVIPSIMKDDGRRFVELLHSCEDDWDRGQLYRENQEDNNDTKDGNEDEDKSTEHGHGTDKSCVFDGDTASGVGNVMPTVGSMMMVLFAKVWLHVSA